jgi:hypothetical protein
LGCGFNATICTVLINKEVYGLGKPYQVRFTPHVDGGMLPEFLASHRVNSINYGVGGELAVTSPVSSVLEAGDLIESRAGSTN